MQETLVDGKGDSSQPTTTTKAKIKWIKTTASSPPEKLASELFEPEWRLEPKGVTEVQSVLKGAGDNVLPTRGMVDLECKIGKIKVIMRKVVICALDLNVLSSYSLHEQGWETRLGTLKVSGSYHKKVKFPLKISDRAWWLEVLVLKHPGHHVGKVTVLKTEIDHAGTVQSSLSSKACQRPWKEKERFRAFHTFQQQRM